MRKPEIGLLTHPESYGQKGQRRLRSIASEAIKNSIWHRMSESRVYVPYEVAESEMSPVLRVRIGMVCHMSKIVASES